MKKLSLLLLMALALPGTAAAGSLDSAPKDGLTKGTLPRDSKTGGSTYGDQNRGGTRGFYAYPRSRSVDGSRLGQAYQRDSASLTYRSTGRASQGTSPYDNSHGSAYYGRDYGAPYFGGGYYHRGTYYRERRD